MQTDDQNRIEAALRSKVVPAGRWNLYPRDRNTPMNAILREAERDLGPVANYWLDQTPADVFCLTGFAEVVAVLCPRYVELWADIRALSMNTVFSGDLKPVLAERLALKIIAEFALLRGDPELAISAMLQAAMTCNGIVIVPNTVAALQHEPLDSPYMSCWFFGLSHELGRLMEPRRRDGVAHAYPDEYFFGLIEAILRNYPGLEGTTDQALAEARSGRPDFLLNPGRLRSEAIADIFAGVCVLNVTADVMAEEKKAASSPDTVPSFNVSSTAYEMFLSVMVQSFMERCRQPAANDFERSLQPAAVRVRLNMLRNHFSGALTAFIFGPEATPDQRAQVDGMLTWSLDDLATLVMPIETGFAKAIATTLNPNHRPNPDHLYEAWKSWTQSQPEVIKNQAQADLRAFCTRANTWSLAGPEIGRLSAAIGDIMAPPN